MKVCIFDEGFIPGLGRGPFRTPIEVSADKYALYKRMGLKVIDASKTVSIAESGVINRVRKVKEEEIPEEVEEVIESPIEEAKEEEIPEEVEEVDINSLTKKELIQLLTENGIECNNNMTKSQLISLFE